LEIPAAVDHLGRRQAITRARTDQTEGTLRHELTDNSSSMLMVIVDQDKAKFDNETIPTVTAVNAINTNNTSATKSIVLGILSHIISNVEISLCELAQAVA